MFKKIFIVCGVVVTGVCIYLLLNRNTNQQLKNKYTAIPVTNTWYSSLFFDQYGKTLVALPLSFKLTQTSFQIIKSPKPSFGGKSITSDLTPELNLNFYDNSNFINKKITSAGEWDVEFEALGEKDNLFSVHLIKGSPTLYFKNRISSVALSGDIEKTSKYQNAYVIETKRKNIYILKSSNNIATEGNKIIIKPGSGTTTLTTLPDEATISNQTLLDSILSCVSNEPDTTSITVNQNSDTSIHAGYYFGQVSNKQENFLFTVWPNQNTQNLGQPLGTYSSVKGDLNLTCANHIDVNVNTQELPLDWSSTLDIKTKNLDVARKLLEKDVFDFEKLDTPKGVYFKGKYIKNLTDLWEMAKILGDKKIETNLFSKLKDLILETPNDFYFDNKSLSVFSKNPEFGNEKGNDHNLQYGYYIYSISKIYTYLSISEKSKVEELVNNFATEGIPAISENQTYPRKIRFLDEYESHSWADSHSLFDDGNNLESSSEALFYWYSLYLWSIRSDNKNLELWSKYAFFTELTGRNTYWFLSNNLSLSQKFSKPIISLVWGAKSDYATWFSSAEDQILGIQILPVNPSSFVSLKLDNNTKAKIFGYYDNILGKNPTDYIFGGYYIWLKKINNTQNLPDIKPYNNEFYSRALSYLAE